MFFEWMQKGGGLMFPLLALSVAVWVLIVERCLYWWRALRSPAGKIQSYLPDRQGHEKRIHPLATVAVSLGLLGSVVGMIQAFGAFHGAPDPKQVAEGLAVAFYTTEMGLSVSIPATLACYAFGVCANKLEIRAGVEPKKEGQP